MKCRAARPRPVSMRVQRRSLRRAAGRLQVGQLGPNVGRIRMIEVAQNGQGLLPGVPGRVHVAGFAAGLAEMGQGIGGRVGNPHIPEQLKRRPVTRFGSCVFAEMVMDVTESVPGIRRTGLIPEHLVQRESLLRVMKCLLIFPEQGVTPADRVQRGGFPRLVMTRLV
jgi:hypothetical protein